MAWGVEQIVRRGSRALLDLERASWRAVRAHFDDIPPRDLRVLPPGPSFKVFQPCALAHRNLMCAVMMIWVVRAMTTMVIIAYIPKKVVFGLVDTVIG